MDKRPPRSVQIPADGCHIMSVRSKGKPRDFPRDFPRLVGKPMENPPEHLYWNTLILKRRQRWHLSPPWGHQCACCKLRNRARRNVRDMFLFFYDRKTEQPRTYERLWANIKNWEVYISAATGLVLFISFSWCLNEVFGSDATGLKVTLTLVNQMSLQCVDI